MYWDNEDGEEKFWNRIEFTYREGGPDKITKSVEVTIEDKESYVDIMQQFVYFLQSIGYTYVDGLVAVNADGKDLASTD